MGHGVHKYSESHNKWQTFNLKVLTDTWILNWHFWKTTRVSFFILRVGKLRKKTSMYLDFLGGARQAQVTLLHRYLPTKKKEREISCSVQKHPHFTDPANDQWLTAPPKLRKHLHWWRSLCLCQGTYGQLAQATNIVMTVIQQNLFSQQSSTVKVLLQLRWHLATPTESPREFIWVSDGREG